MNNPLNSIQNKVANSRLCATEVAHDLVGKKVSQIEDVCRSLDQRISHQNDIISKLHDRLKNVLAPMPPATTSQEQYVGSFCVPLASQLEAFVARIQSNNEYIEMLLSLLDL